MSRHTRQTQYDCTPDGPDPLYAMKPQEILGGASEPGARRRARRPEPPETPAARRVWGKRRF
jgi:hypothetical protein